MAERIFDFDPLTGQTEYFDYDESNDTFRIRTEQNVDPLLELNKQLRREFSSGKDKWGDGFDHRTKVASIPLNIYFDLVKKGVTRDPVAFKRWLNDPDNFAFRTRPGVV